MYTCLSPGAIGVNLPFPEAAKLAAAHSFQGIQIDVGYVQKEGAGPVRELLEELGLKPGSFGLPLAFREGDDVYRESLARLEAGAEAARQVGCTRCSTWILSWSETLDFAQNFAFHRDRLRPAAQILADKGITVRSRVFGPEDAEGREAVRVYSYDRGDARALRRDRHRQRRASARRLALVHIGSR